MQNNKPRVTVRLTPGQLMVLEELRTVLNCNISLIVRAIVGDWLAKNEEHIYNIIDGKTEFDKNWLNTNKNEN